MEGVPKRDDCVKQYGRRTLAAACQIVTREMPSAWEYQVVVVDNPDISPLYALAKLYSTVTLGATVNGNGKWRLYATGTGRLSAPSAATSESGAITQMASEYVPEYYKTAIHEVAILLLQQYTNYHWTN